MGLPLTPDRQRRTSRTDPTRHSQFNDGLDSIREGIASAGQSYSQPQTLTDQTVAHLRQIIEGLRAVPVQVDIKVVPVQDEKGSIEKMDAPDSPALEFKPEVNQG